MLGNPAHIDTLATEVYFSVYEIQPPRYGTASIISVIYVIMTTLTVAAYLYVTRKTFKFVVVTGKAPRESVHNLRRWRKVALLVCLTILTLSYFLPYGTLVLMSFTNFFSAAGGSVQLTFTLKNYYDVLNLPLIYTAIINSISLGLAAGILATLAAVFLSYSALKSKVRGARIIEFIASVPLAFPGIVYGLAFFWTFLLFPGLGLIYGTIWPLIIALVFIRLPYCVRIISGSLIQIADELEEASRVSGASWVRTFYKVLLPLLRRGMINSFLYTFINALRELGAVVLLVTSQSIVLTALLLNLYTQHALALHTLAAAAVLLSTFIFIALALPNLIQYVSAFRKHRSPKG
jgi:iron(III) transport system permease protein